MGNRKSSIKPVNIECPICLEQTSNIITLSCGHSFDYYCIQMSTVEYILNNKVQHCPYCRTQIKKKDLKKIFKKIVCLNINPDEWTEENTENKLDKLKIKEKFKINVDEYTNIFLPTYKKHKILYFRSPRISNLNKVFIDNFMIFSREYKNSFTEYNEEVPVFTLALDGLINTFLWSEFIKKNLIIKTNNKTDLIYHYDFSKYKIRFYIKDVKNIITYDIQYGHMNLGLILKSNRESEILFKTYYICHKNNIFLVNEMFGIMYF